ncbi:TetR family transcriptional regulator [Gordonia sp. (in: high G+C Gram-positive bacteria)]|uniref:TetR family transcriptional regulator n=1 Tax=Gordonia sp. (in: high G+C Gram-positive bacteria) TaxID=84139 RepID=UPI001D6820E0|nr:TetR family transcriptional regulator [Gordonia sp. (in: high G+C Gram-positive bacteria)]MCB1296037.1 TetR family transcriptional regulator [Gordonia sp. (in: high G+C Gram-positive bacteria)]HMS76545.1 TetR family transcriptional regulator [Gordonia sp. (in: high G+C Gram-positive bacteria)]
MTRTGNSTRTSRGRRAESGDGDGGGTSRPASTRAGAARADPKRADAESRADRKSRTRQALLDTTLDLVSERSFASISLREVARGAGIVPTAFYRHFASMEDLGVTLVEDSMRVLRRTLRDGRRDLAARQALPTVRTSIDILFNQVREDESAFRFLIREQHGGVTEVRRAIDTERRLFAKELAIDLARLPDLSAWDAEDLEMVADLIVTIMLTSVAEYLDSDYRGRGLEREVIDRVERQLVLVFLGMDRWRSRRDH